MLQAAGKPAPNAWQQILVTTICMAVLKKKYRSLFTIPIAHGK